jgi:hypothetical protein
MRRLLRLAAVTSVVLATVVMGAGAAGAAEFHPHSNICGGTVTSPGVLAGNYYGNVVVTGVCAVDDGAAVIEGNLTLAPGSALNATFALNDVAGSGTSSLTVFGNVTVGSGAVLGMGCEPNYFPCSDDPNAATGGTLTGQNHVFGNVTALDALTVIVHASTINGNLTYLGGGGGTSCAVPTSGILAALESPPYFDAEDNTVSNLTIAGTQTCWVGALRNHVRGVLVYSDNNNGDPDSGEVMANLVGGSIFCFSNSPAVQYGDSGSSPNQIRGAAFGECAFGVEQPNPAPTPTNAAGPLEPISVKI